MILIFIPKKEKKFISIASIVSAKIRASTQVCKEVLFFAIETTKLRGKESDDREDKEEAEFGGDHSKVGGELCD